jgi:hypothetical protein
MSWVDEQGRLRRQELTLVGDFFRWTSAEGLVTGSEASAEGSKARKASDALHVDSKPSLDRVSRSVEALSGYGGDDKYILHIREVLRAAEQGLSWSDEAVVTAARPALVLPTAFAKQPKWVFALLALIVAALGWWLASG